MGAFAARLLDDMAPGPEPADPGYLFPRQFPIWSSRLYTREGELVRTTVVSFHPDGRVENDFSIEVGEYLETVGVPMWVESPEGTVVATACELRGWPRLLPENAVFTVAAGRGEVGETRADEPVTLTVKEEVEVVVTGPDVTMPAVAGGGTTRFRAVLSLRPKEQGKALAVTVRVLRGGR